MFGFFTPPEYDDEEKTLAARNLFLVLKILLLTGLMPLLIAVAIPSTFRRWATAVVFVEAAGICLLYLNKKGQTQLAGHLTIATIWVLATVLALTNGGVHANAMMVYLLAVFVAGFIQSVKAGILTSILCMLTGLALVALEYAGMLPPYRVPHNSVSLWIINCMFMAVTIVMQAIVSLTVRNSFRKSREELRARQTALLALAESEERFRSIFENAREGIFQSTHEGRFIKVNPAMARMWGYASPAEMIEEVKDIAKQHYADPDKRAVFLETMEKCGGVEGYLHEIRRKDGSRIWVSLNARIVRDAAGRIAFYEGSHEDITERLQMEAALRESRELYRGMSEQSHTAICLVDEEAKIVWANKKMMDIGGYTEEEFYRAESFILFLAPESMEFVIGNFRKFVAGKPYERHYFLNIVRKDGEKRYCEKYMTDIKDMYGKRHLVINILDITDRVRDEEERKAMEDRLRRSEKMEALGLLAGGVAHDLNNILGVMAGYSQLLLSEIGKDSNLREHVDYIVQSSERAATVVQDLLTLARRGAAVMKILDLNKTVYDYFRSPEYEGILSRHPRVRLKIELSDTLLRISGSSVHLMKTLMNLVANAAEAMPRGGELTVRTENRYLDRPVKGYDDLQPGEYVVLSVSDKGDGIPAQDMKRIFEPFYTKKMMGHSGTGLGLTVVWGTVKDHNGYIDVASTEGRGTTFSLYFPATRDESGELSVLPEAAYMGRGESILVVDDVQGQRDLATRMLTKLNYRAVAVACGEEAVEYLKANACDLIILDMIMDPGIDGLETYQRIVEFRPGQKAVIVSGYAETERVAKAQECGAGAYVRKPYMLERLGMEVRKELDRIS
jgi:PAS domain S-box-containing protein